MSTPEYNVRSLAPADRVAYFEMWAQYNAFYETTVPESVTHTWSDRQACYLEDLFVRPAARGRGVGRALIEWLAGLAVPHGFDRLYWMTREGNTAARNLYDRLAERDDFIRYEMKLPGGSLIDGKTCNLSSDETGRFSCAACHIGPQMRARKAARRRHRRGDEFPLMCGMFFPSRLATGEGTRNRRQYRSRVAASFDG